MCRHLGDLESAIRAYAGRFDAGALTPGQAESVVRGCSAMEGMISTIRSMAAARAAESQAWKAAGYRSPADQLAHETGVSTTAARSMLDTGRRLSEQPDVAQAALGGQLSPQQASLVADGVTADPARARDLIRRARHGSLSELQDEVARVKAAATDLEERRRTIHRRRTLRSFTDPEGVWHLHAAGHPEDGAALHYVIDTIRRDLIVRRRERGERDDFQALAYDSLMLLSAIARGAATEMTFADLQAMGLFPGVQPSTAGQPPAQGGQPRRRPAGAPVQLQVRVDLATLLRGVPLEGELCEIVGWGPVPVSVIEDLVATGNTFVVGALTRAEEIVGVRHHGRAPRAHQRSALDFLYPTCAAEGCNVKAGLQYDHRVDWAQTHFTAFDLMDRLCGHHHGLKTRENWALVAGRGKRPFVSPSDPRHPDHRGAPSPAVPP